VTAFVLTLAPFAAACLLALLGGGADGPARTWLTTGLVAAAILAAALHKRASWPWTGIALTAFVLLQTVATPSAWSARPALTPTFFDAAGVELRHSISFDASATALGAVLLAAAIAAFSLARAGASRSPQAAAAAVAALATVCAAEAVVGAGQYAAGLVAEGGDAVARGTFTSRAHFSAFLLAGMGAALGLGCAALNSSLRQALATAVACWALAAACAVGVALSLSRAGIVIACAQVIAAIWWLGPRRRRVAALAFAATVGLALAALAPQTQRLASQRFAELVESKGDPGRLAIWQDTAPLVAGNALLGVGLEAYSYAFRRSEPYFARKTVFHAHSDPVEFAAELGLPFAALLLGATLLTGIRTARALHRRTANRSRSERALAAGCLLGAAATALQSLVDSPLHLPATALSFAALLGVSSGLALRPRKPSRTRRAAGIAIAAAVLINASLWSPHVTPDVFRRAETLLAEGRTVQAGEAYRELLSVNPFTAPAWQRLAGIARAEGRTDEALKMVRAAHEVEPFTLRTVWRLAEAELQAGQVDAAVERLASIVVHEPDLRPAAYLAAHRGGAPVELIERRLASEQAYAAGEYLAFLTRIKAWDRWPAAYKRFAKHLDENHRRFLDQALAERRAASEPGSQDHSAGR